MNTACPVVMLVSSSAAVNTHFCCPRTHRQKAMLTLSPRQVYCEGNKPKPFGGSVSLCSSSLTFAVYFSNKVTRGRNHGGGGETQKSSGAFPPICLQLQQAASRSSQGLFFCSTVWKVRCDTIAGSDDLAFLLHLERTGIGLHTTWLSCL